MIASFALAAGSIFGLWLVSRWPRVGWTVCMFMEIPWVIYAYLSDVPGLAVLCGFYFIVYAYNLFRTKRDSTKQE